MARYEVHHFQKGETRTIPMTERPTQVYSWYGQGEPHPPYIPRFNVMPEDTGHDWSWRGGQFRYSGTQVVGEFQGVTCQTVQKPFWVICQFGEDEPQTCAHCGARVGVDYVFCTKCGTPRT